MRSQWLSSQKGHMLLQILIIMPLLCAILFLPLNFAIVQHQRSVLNDTLDLLLQRAAVLGGITEQLRQEILSELEERGFDPAKVVINPQSYIEKTRGELIQITISVPGDAGLLKGVRALGGTPPPDDWEITATGCIMSEKLP